MAAAPAGTTRRPLGRALGWARKRPERLRGHNPWEVAVVAALATGRHRLTGTSAEMSFFAVLALVPLTVTFGAALGYLGRIVGTERILEGREAVIAAVAMLLSPELTSESVAPFIRWLLTQERGGLALSGLLVTFWLASRVFTPAMRALDTAYGVDSGRSPLRQRLIALALAVGSMVASSVTLVLMIAGPLVGQIRQVAERLEVSRALELAWSVGRWPLLLAIVVGFLVSFYRFAPSLRLTWAECLPGAVVGVLLWVLVAAGFRAYLAAGGRPGADVVPTEETLVAVGRAVGAVVATMLWTFLSSLAILVGGEVNAALRRRCRSLE